MNFVKDHPEGVGKAVGVGTTVAANAVDFVAGLFGKKPEIAKHLRDLKKDVNPYLDKNPESGFEKFVKGFHM